MQPYNGYFPASYQNPYSQTGYINQMPTPPIQAQTNQPPVSTMGGFIPVQNENEARMYRLAPGTSATFIDENAPYCYTKTEGVSQLDRPVFKRFRLVEEMDSVQETPQGTQSFSGNAGIDFSKYALQADMNALAARIDALQEKIENVIEKEETGA
ncbi:MAG: hypothetical protein IJH64_00610 [Oscillospiraceae bacterium]|nr:hypothetical protein [Oscillospiraceae bacterium]